MQRKWFGISALGNFYQFAIIIIKFFLTYSRDLFVNIGILYICKIYTYVCIYVYSMSKISILKLQKVHWGSKYFV